MKILIKKECREHQLFFLLSIVITLLGFALMTFYQKRINCWEFQYTLFQVILPFIFAVLFGTIPFTKEFTQNTKSFLLSHPVSSDRIFWVKFLTGLVPLLILMLVFYLLSGIIDGLADKTTKISFTNNMPIFYYLISTILIYSASILGSLLFKNFFPAILGTPILLFIVGLILAPFLVVIFLIAPFLHCFTSLLFASLIGIFLLLGFLTWQKESVGSASSIKTVIKILVPVFIISLLIHGISTLITGIELKKAESRAKSAGLPSTIGEILPPAIPDEDNGAIIYNQAFKELDQLKKRYQREWETISESPYTQHYLIHEMNFTPEFKKNVSPIIRNTQFNQMYQLLKEATSTPSCRFDLNYNEGFAMMYPQLVKMDDTLKLLSVKTSLLINEGRFQEALDIAGTIWKMGDSIADEPILVSQIVRIRIKRVARSIFAEILEEAPIKVSHKELNEFLKVSHKEEIELYIKGLKGDYATGMSLFKVAKGEQKDSGDIFYDTYEQYFTKLYGLSLLLRPILNKDQAFYLKTFTKYVELIYKPYFVSEKESKMWDRQLSGKSFKKKKKILSSMLGNPVLDYTMKRQSEYIAGVDTLKLAVALKMYEEEHNRYPESLSSLQPDIISEIPVDPFTGNDYIYRLEGNGFILYSLGPNQKDDGGFLDRKNEKDDISLKVKK